MPPALRETVAFPHRMHLGGDWHLSVADSQARPTPSPGSRSGRADGEAHNHNDVGSVVVASDGVPVVVDAGRPTYTAQTFGPDRYEIWTMQSSWHSVPQVAGVAQGVGREFAARDVQLLGPPDDVTGLALDLAGAYPVAGLRTWRRTAQLERVDDVARAVVDDAWHLDGDDAPTTVRFLLAGDVDLDTARAVVRAPHGDQPAAHDPRVDRSPGAPAVARRISSGSDDITHGARPLPVEACAASCRGT